MTMWFLYVFVCFSFFGSEGVVGQRCGDPCVGSVSVCIVQGGAWECSLPEE